ncbi:hypothetical protein PG989_006555 [Apiospora arundinis]|uniref:Cytochrome P450 n=1 Tax=Apiospora arundinis TaxID=335852 RepID=A0ABR2I7E8_9PEZI
MAFNTPSVIASLLIAAATYALYTFAQWLATTRRPPNFPPGPPATLGLGNVTQIPRDYPFLKYQEWAKQYGPITGLKIGPINAVVLNEAPLVYDLIVKRGQHWSGRPSRYVAKNHVWPDSPYTHSVTMSWENSRKMRSGTKQYMLGTGLRELLPLHQAAATRLIYDLFQSKGSKWEETVYSWAVKTPVAMLSGAKTDELGPNWVEEYEASQHLYESILDPATAPPVDLFPVLRWVPARFAEWKRKAPVARRALDKVYGAMFDHAKNRRHGSFPSLINKLLAHSADPSTDPEDRLTDYEINLLMGGTLDAAAHSSAVTFQIILFALLTHPEALRRAQTEVDAVLGTGDTLPDKIDPQQSMPFLMACIFESLRWRPVSTLSLPRETTEDQEVMGYHVPKGTMVLQNIWNINMDPDYYDEPGKYKPERYLDNPLGAKPGAPHQPGRKNVYTFGTGRRECPGAAFFYQGMGLAYAQLLWAFTIEPVGRLDPDDLKGTFMHSLVLHPRPFGVRFVPRRADTASVLLTERAKADAAFDTMLA